MSKRKKYNTKNVFLLFIVGVTVFFSCKKEYSCEGCADKNKPPIAVAGLDQVIILPTDSVSLDGYASSDPDGTISKWLWTKISGPASFNILKPSDSITKVKALVVGVYKFELKVTDNGGMSAKDTVQVIVNDPSIPNRPPVANAGTDQTITLPTNTITLNGNGSTDPDNNITSYSWTIISGPSSYNIMNSNVVQTQVTNLVEGIYQFVLKVTDAGGLFSRDTVQVRVEGTSSVIQGIHAIIYCDPYIIAAPNNQLQIEAHAYYQVQGSPDVFVQNLFQWTQVSGPNTANIANPVPDPRSPLVTTNFTNLISGTYTFALAVSNNNLIGYDTATVNVIVDTLSGKEFIFNSAWVLTSDGQEEFCMTSTDYRPDLFYYNPFRPMIVSIKLQNSSTWIDIPNGYISTGYCYDNGCNHLLWIYGPHPIDRSMVGQAVSIRIRFL